jgi:hypothetical protein
MQKTWSHDAVEHCETFECRWMNLCVWIIAKTIEVSLNITDPNHPNQTKRLGFIRISENSQSNQCIAGSRLTCYFHFFRAYGT